MNDFSVLNLSTPLLRALEANNFLTPTAIQSKAIPIILGGRDVIGLSQTGGGKTAAFVLPILEKLIAMGDKARPGAPRALILAPTRELAKQITDCVAMFAGQTHLYQTAIYGGAPYGPQMKALRRGVDVLVATPGRLKDHIKRGNIDLSETSFLVLDEADKMLEMGFVDEVKEIVKIMPAGRQTTFFSATSNRNVERLAKEILKDSIRIEIERKEIVSSNVKHKVMFVDFPNKRNLLSWLIEKDNPQAMLIFTRTKSDADKLSDHLRKEGHQVDAIHGDKKQSVRERVLRRFRNGELRILVATDVAARGIDVPSISHVVNMTLPIETEGYVHRVGRTGRGKAKGVAYSFCDRQDRYQLTLIERYIKTEIEPVLDQPFHEEFIARPVKGGGKQDGRFQRKGKSRGNTSSQDRNGFKGKRNSQGGQRKRTDRDMEFAEPKLWKDGSSKKASQPYNKEENQRDDKRKFGKKRKSKSSEVKWEDKVDLSFGKKRKTNPNLNKGDEGHTYHRKLKKSSEGGDKPGSAVYSKKKKPTGWAKKSKPKTNFSNFKKGKKANFRKAA